MNNTAEHLGAKASDPSEGLNVRWIPELRDYIEGFLDPNRLTSELPIYEEWARDNSAPVLQGGFLHRPTGTNMLVAAISACKDWEANRSDLPPTAAAKRLVGTLPLLQTRLLLVITLVPRRWVKPQTLNNAILPRKPSFQVRRIC